MDGDDVGVVEGRHRARLAFEAVEPLWVVREIYRQYFERDLAVQFGVLRSPHLPHPTGAEGRGDPVVGERLADHAVPSPSSFFEVQLLHQRGKARVRAQRIEGPVVLEPTQPLRVQGVGLFQQAHRARIIAQTEGDERAVEGSDIAIERHGFRSSTSASARSRSPDAP